MLLRMHLSVLLQLYREMIFAVANVAKASAINLVVVSNDTTVAVVNVVELHLTTNKQKGKMLFKYETIT